jgi:hypothetical protein
LYLGSERYVDAQRRFDSAAANGFSTQGIYNAYLYAAQRQFDRAEKTLAAGKKTGIDVDDAQTLYPAITLALDRGNWDTARAAATSAQNATVAMKGTLHAEFTLIELGLRALTEPDETLKPAFANYFRSLETSSTRDTPDAQFNLLFAAYLASHAGHTDLAKTALSHVTSLSRSGDYPYLSSLLVVVDAELARTTGNPQQAIALLKSHIDGSEYYFSHRALMDAYATQHDYANALIEAQWLAQHRGRAYAEQFGQDMLRPFNVALSDLALLDAAELSVRLKNRDAARSSLDDLRKAWPHADQMQFLQKRLQTLDAALPGKPSAS